MARELACQQAYRLCTPLRPGLSGQPGTDTVLLGAGARVSQPPGAPGGSRRGHSGHVPYRRFPV